MNDQLVVYGFLFVVTLIKNHQAACKNATSILKIV